LGLSAAEIRRVDCDAPHDISRDVFCKRHSLRAGRSGPKMAERRQWYRGIAWTQSFENSD
ncbi:hypothetical protein, partial [Staphylococcus aureus]